MNEFWRKFDGFQFLSSNNRWFIGMYWVRYSNTHKDNRYLVFCFSFIHPPGYRKTIYLHWNYLGLVGSWRKKKVLSFFLLLSGTRTEIVCFFWRTNVQITFTWNCWTKRTILLCVCVCTKFHSDFFLFAYYLSMWLNDDDTPTIFFSFFLNEWMTEWNKKKGRKPVDDDRTTRTIWQWKC